MIQKTRAVATGIPLLLALLPARSAGAEPDQAPPEPEPMLAGEIGLGSMLSSYQRDVLGYGLDVQGSLRAGLRVVPPLTIEIAFTTWWFPSSELGYGRAAMLGGGARFEPWRRGRLGVFVDAHAGLGFTGAYTRFAFDAGAGLEVALARGLGLGPALRYGQTVTADDRAPVDAKYWSLGAQLVFRFLRPPPPPPPPPPSPPPPPPPPDGDGDGVPDASDACPQEPAGARPDPAPSRQGCPLVDTDQDGVFDNEDRCPNERQGLTPDPERPGCPAGDDDKDGVMNHADQCKDEPAGLQPDPGRPGCPMPDRDKDNVPDHLDACPDKPGAPDPAAKKNGCPGLVLIEASQIKILKPVYFATGKDTILKTSHPLLKAVAEALKSTPAITKLSIQGHTDDRGKPEVNLELSNRRAESVRAFLVQNGVEAARLEAVGFGDTRPIEPNTTSRARAKNRRVEFLILEPAPAAPSN
jgi:outer membrane protein OmpA-like peptidoglycan-associated protein